MVKKLRTDQREFVRRIFVGAKILRQENLIRVLFDLYRFNCWVMPHELKEYQQLEQSIKSKILKRLVNLGLAKKKGYKYMVNNSALGTVENFIFLNVEIYLIATGLLSDQTSQDP